MELKVVRRRDTGDGVAVVVLDRPGRGNSWTARMNAEFRSVMAGIDDDPAVRVVVVTGAGAQFCVGADAKALDHHRSSDVSYVETVSAPGMATPGHGVRPEFDHDLVWLWGMRLPVIAAVNGACAGIACALVSFCDLRYGAAGAKWTTAAPRLGLPAEYGLSWALPRLVGLSAATDLLFTGRVVRSEDLAAMGYYHGVFEAGEAFLPAVVEVASGIATSVSPASLAATKRQLYADLLHVDPGASVEESKRLTDAMMKGRDFAEGVAALAAKRPARF